MREAYFHEDDYCQIELLPVDNLQHCLQQMGEQEVFADAHASDAGWTDMYVRSAPPSPLSALGITAAQLQHAVGALLPPYDAVFTGYGSYRVACPNVLAFGGDETETLFAGINDDGVVVELWCSDGMAALLLLPQHAQLLYADWNAGFVCPMAEQPLFQRYLKAYELD